jgi:hypothetical protein
VDGDRPVEWSAAERDALEGLGRASPPDDLEASVVTALKGKGLVGSGGTGSPRGAPGLRVPAHRRWGWTALALAACVAAFYAGISVADRGAGRSSVGAPPAGERFLLLLYEDDAYRAAATPAERQARVREYSGWAAGVHVRGIEIDGEELAPPAESRMLDGRTGDVIATEGSSPGAAGALTGYFIIEAPDADAAVATARTMPHLAYGGTVVVRRVVRH